MKFKLDTQIPLFNQKITYPKSIIFLGSCFSDDVSERFKQAGFDVLSNPFGTIFHPDPLARILENSLEETAEIHAFEHRGKYYSWDAATGISAGSKTELENKFRNIQLNLREYLQKSSHLFITLGSAWGYELAPQLPSSVTGGNYLVANCHKQNKNLFEKQLSEIEKMKKPWENVLRQVNLLNPELEIVFTVSPVRHSKDGLLENNRSKARLFELISQLEKEHPIRYFPSYEIVLDELRDYRFFKEDMVHPNKLAIDFIWEKIRESFLDEDTKRVCLEAEKLRLLELHRPLSQDPEELQHFELSKKMKIGNFLKENPDVNW